MKLSRYGKIYDKFSRSFIYSFAHVFFPLAIVVLVINLIPLVLPTNEIRMRNIKIFVHIFSIFLLFGLPIFKFFFARGKFLVVENGQFSELKIANRHETKKRTIAPTHTLKKIVIVKSYSKFPPYGLGMIHLFFEGPNFGRKIFTLQDLNAQELEAYKATLKENFPNVVFSEHEKFPMTDLHKEWT